MRNLKDTKQHFHGSDLEKIEHVYQIPKEELTNFSANVNPLGISPMLRTQLSKHVDLIAHYPDRQYTQLKEKISQYTGADKQHIGVGNGSTELISLFINRLHPKKALIIGPTYSEYEREIFLGGGSSHYYRLKEEQDFKIDVHNLKKQLTEDIDLLVLCNPNNPTSSSIYQHDLRQILDYCKELDIFVLIDETYVEFSNKIEEVTAIPLTAYYNNLIIIRGVSKFFSAPGLRLGYSICGNQPLRQKIDSHKNPWTISSLASYAGEIMFDDQAYISKTKALIRNEREKIYHTLSSWKNVKTFAPTANFILVKLLKDTLPSSELFKALIQKRMMIRDASSFPFLNDKFFRFCFMMPEDNERLLLELRKHIEAQ